MRNESSELDIEKLLATEDASERQLIPPVLLENQSHRFVRTELETIVQELKVLRCRAMTEVDQFMVANGAAEKGDKTTLRCRVRHKASTLEISWEHQYYFERKSQPKAGSKAKVFMRENADGKKRLYGLKSKHIKKGLADRYARRSFDVNSEPQWAIETADQMEEKFELLRQQIRILGQIRKLLYHYDQLTKRYFDLITGDEVSPERLAPIVVGQSNGD